MEQLRIRKIIGNSVLNLKGNTDLAFNALIRAIPIMIFADACIFMWWGPNPTKETMQEHGNKILPILGLTLLSMIVWVQMIWAWHRIYLVRAGREETKFTPLKMSHHQLQFMLKGVLILFIFMLMLLAGWSIALAISATIKAFGSYTESWGIAIFTIATIVTFYISITTITRFSLYFPAKALGDYISLRRSYKMMRGLTWKLLGSNIIILIIAQIISAIYLVITPDLYTTADTPPMNKVIQFVMDMPARVFIPTIAGLLCVSNLSQTYAWVKSNRMME